jgi:hypothetical protein
MPPTGARRTGAPRLTPWSQVILTLSVAMSEMKSCHSTQTQPSEPHAFGARRYAAHEARVQGGAAAAVGGAVRRSGSARPAAVAASSKRGKGPRVAPE